MINALVIADQDTVERLSTTYSDAAITRVDEEKLEKELRSDQGKPHVVLLESGSSSNVQLLQMIGRSDGDVSVIILADQDDVTALRQRIVFLPFHLTSFHG